MRRQMQKMGAGGVVVRPGDCCGVGRGVVSSLSREEQLAGTRVLALLELRLDGGGGGGALVDGRPGRSSGTSDRTGRRRGADEREAAAGGVFDGGSAGRSSGTSGFTGPVPGRAVKWKSGRRKMSLGGAKRSVRPFRVALAKRGIAFGERLKVLISGWKISLGGGKRLSVPLRKTS